GGKPEQALDRPVQPAGELVVVNHVEDFRIVKIPQLVETALVQDDVDQDALPLIGPRPLEVAHKSRVGGRIDEDVVAGGQAALNRPGVAQVQGGQKPRVGEGIVNERVRMRGEDVPDCVVGLHSIDAEESADLDVQSPGNRGDVSLSVELDWVDPIE